MGMVVERKQSTSNSSWFKTTITFMYNTQTNVEKENKSQNRRLFCHAIAILDL